MHFQESFLKVILKMNSLDKKKKGRLTHKGSNGLFELDFKSQLFNFLDFLCLPE